MSDIHIEDVDLPDEPNDIELVGEPISISYFAGGMDGPTFRQRRKVILNAYVQLESLEVYRQSEDMAVRFGEELGRTLHAQLNAID